MRYFRYKEFDSPDLVGSGKEMQETTLLLLDLTRQYADIPFIITSGVRTSAWNAKVGGVFSSSHITGHAVDIKCRNSSDRYKIINAALDAGFNRIGISGLFIHLDNDSSKVKNVIWTY